jgi:hypothetical protein
MLADLVEESQAASLKIRRAHNPILHTLIIGDGLVI